MSGEQESILRKKRGESLSDTDNEDSTFLSFPYEQEERNIGRAIWTLLIWATLGLIFTLPGPNLLGITCNLRTQLDEIGCLFVGRGVGALIGAVIARSIIYRVRGYVVLVKSLFCLAVSVSMFPATQELGGATAMMVVIGLAYGASMEGFVVMDESSSAQNKDRLDKKSLAFAIGAAITPFLSLPFIENLIAPNSGQNHTVNNRGMLMNQTKVHGAIQTSRICHIFPDKAIISTNNYGKVFWISITPCCILMFSICVMMIRESDTLIFNQPVSNNMRRPVDFKVIALRFVLFGVMFFYQGSFITAAVVVFSYIYLGPFDTGKMKTALLVSLLWVSFAFGLLMLQLIFKKITKPEKRLGVGVFKSSICFIAAIVFMKITDLDSQGLTLIIYMFFFANISTIVEDVLVNQAVVSRQILNTMRLIAAALAEAVFPFFSLALMYHKGWHAMSFALLFVSLMQFLACTLLALCPVTLQRDLVTMHYQNLTETVEDGNGRKIHKQIKSLLGGYTDQDSTFEASEEEVLFDKKRNREY